MHRKSSLLVVLILCAVALIASQSAYAANTQVFGTASAGTSSSKHPAPHMIDGNTASYWAASSAALPQLVTIDLGTQRNLTACDVIWKVKSAPGFRVYGSNDASVWYELGNADANTLKTTHTVISGTYRYVRIRVHSLRLGSAGIYEWKVYATPTPTPTVTVTATPTPTPTPTASASSSVSVLDYGAKADGVSDDSAAILAAVNAAEGKQVYLPAGTYKLAGTLAVPAGARLVGAGLASTWIRGRIDFNNNSSFSDMKIGDSGKAAVHSGSTTTHDVSFTRCQFRGGNGARPGDNAVILLNNNGGPVHLQNISFTDCNVECNLGVEDAGHTNRFNNVSIAPANVAPSIDNLVFTRCHFGVWNGVRSGSPSFNVEIWVDPNAATRTHGFQNLNFIDCVFEAADDENLDYSGSTLSTDTTKPNNGPCRVTGCTFKGDGRRFVWFGSLIIESGAGYIEVAGNTFYRGAGQAIVIGGNNGQNVATACNVHDNLIDARDSAYATGITHATGEYVGLLSNSNTLHGNTIVNTTQYRNCITVRGEHNSITANTFTNAPSGGNVAALESGSAYNTFSGNVLNGGGVYNGGTSNTVN